jgi:ribosome maturation factor RimP
MSKQLEDLFEPIVTGLGFELWGVEKISQGKYSILKVYIDAENGINVDDCARVSRQIGSLLEVDDPFKGNYTLEVSSPGLDRRLFKLEQYDTYKGAQVKLRLNQPFDGRRNFTGILCGIENEDVIVRSDSEEEILFPIEQIERANIISAI